MEEGAGEGGGGEGARLLRNLARFFDGSFLLNIIEKPFDGPGYQFPGFFPYHLTSELTESENEGTSLSPDPMASSAFSISKESKRLYETH